MTETVEIYFDDLTPEAQSNLLEKFQTTTRDENWDDVHWRFLNETWKIYTLNY
jgi:hypothetical protein